MLSLLQIPCQHNLCTGVAESQPAFCYGCDKVLCRVHLDGPAHTDCREIEVPWEKDDLSFEDALRDLSVDALQERLRILRPGRTVTEITMPDPSEIPEECHGGLNIHIPLLFDDGVKWMLRLNGYNRDHAPFEVSKYVRESEVATMTALQSVTNLVAQVHDWGMGTLSKSNDPRCLFIIFDHKRGAPSEDLFYEPESDTQAARATFIEGYADYAITVAELSYDAIGSLKFGEGGASGRITVGPLVDLYGISGIAPPHFPGPFKTLRDRYILQIDRVLEYTRKGLVGRGRPLYVYLGHLVARSLIKNCADLAKEEGEFFIRQPDALTCQFLSHENEITAVLDWEYANTTCKTHAFSAIEAIFGTKDWLFGNNALTEGEVMLCEAYEQRGRSDLADCVRNGRKYQRLEYVIGNVVLFLYAGGGSFGDAYLLGMLNGLVDAFQGDRAGPLPETREAWFEWALSRHSDDPGLPEIMALEETSDLYRSKWSPDEDSVSDEDAADDVEESVPVALAAH